MERAVTVGRQRIAITGTAAVCVCVLVCVWACARACVRTCVHACVHDVFAIYDYLTQADNDNN